ncbi:MAG: biotin transporter BioY [Crocinitomicaceae bacterium]|nr:biotin transporter BioY [Crocinitomicaceae bacterium]
MLYQLIRFSNSDSTDFTIKLVLSLAILCLAGPHIIHIEGELPVTLQTLFILLFSIAFGWRIGALATLLYIITGALGVPVFAGHTGGYLELVGPFGGFFFGFLTAALICGFLAELPQIQKILPHLLLWFTGHLIILLMGAVWLRQLNPLEWKSMIYEALPGAGAKSAVGFFVLQTSRRIILLKKKSV